TVVATRVLTPAQAVIWAAVFNFIPAFLLGTGVAKKVGSGLVDLTVVTPYVILAGLIGAIAWDLITWFGGLPTSSSHALFGGYAGAAMARVAFTKGIGSSFDALLWDGWNWTLKSIIFAPLLGMVIAYFLMVAIYWVFRRSSPHAMDVYFRKLQLVSAAFFSYSHGANDAQKTMGIITGVLVTSGYLTTFQVPVWVIFSAHAAIGLGTMSGGWRIVHTMGSRLTKLKPRGGFCAETGAAASILLATAMNTPVSTTHVIAGSIAGVGSVQRLKAVRWGLATDILWAWILTIPASAVVAAVAFSLIRLFVPKA
ncbi:MAG: inorganic phosphate transporter, partial [Acidobacteria bacterium]|nr:inorganic phosphate transporter [Acidobacteriota bacterium]